ncbi:MAG TPA: hypothetical protein VGF25_19715 [Thermoleophilaceae bacterium]|jgi:hypothetical protein
MTTTIHDETTLAPPAIPVATEAPPALAPLPEMHAYEAATHAATGARERGQLEGIRRALAPDVALVTPLYEEAKRLEGAYRDELEAALGVVERTRRALLEQPDRRHVDQVKFDAAVRTGLAAKEALAMVTLLGRALEAAAHPSPEALARAKDWTYPGLHGGPGAEGFLRQQLHGLAGAAGAITRTRGAFAEALKALPPPVSEPPSDGPPSPAPPATTRPIETPSRPTRRFAKSNITHEH